MADAFNSQSRSVGDLLGSNQRPRIIVPTFQRGYSWETKHVGSFWRDIIEFQVESRQVNGPERYFLGPIVTRQTSKDELQLLDGQQRLATATILCSVIRDVARSLSITAASNLARDIQVQTIQKEDDGPYSLQLGAMDNLYFNETIQCDPPNAKSPSIRSHRKIKAARDLLHEVVRTEIGNQEPSRAVLTLKKLWQTIRTDLVMACIPVDSERDAFRIFETLNDRGLRLSVPDLLLNYLMRVADPESDREQIRKLWDGMLEEMGKRDINRFLRHMWVSKYGDLKSQDLFSALKAHIEKKSIGSLDFTRACSDECERYVQLLEADDAVGCAKVVVKSLLQELDFQSALPLLLSTYFHFDKANFEKVVRWVLVFVTRYSLVMNLDPSGLETTFYGLARDVRKNMTTKPAMAVPKCMGLIKDALVKAAPNEESVLVAVDSLVLPPDGAKYVLSRIANRMESSTKETKIDEANLEHIFPKSPEDDEWGGKANHAILEPYLWHIGNLTVLGERLNKKAANKEFAEKRAYYEKATELKISQQVAKDYTAWDMVSIKNRAKKLSKYITEIWNFDNPSRV